MKWRTIESQFHNYYKPWYAMGGKFLTLCAEQTFDKRSAADSTEKVQKAVEEFNQQLELGQIEGDDGKLA